MTSFVLAAVICAAILHAGWNAVLRGGSDQLWSMTLMMAAVTLATVVALPWLRGVLLEGTAVRVQGEEEVAVRKGDFWRTPSGVLHTMRAGPEGARVLDIFSPPRPEYRIPGKGFGNS